MSFPLNRLVALLTPIFAGLAGWIVQQIGEHFPGAPNLDDGELTALFVTGAAAALAAAYKWLEGWQRHEERQDLLPLSGEGGGGGASEAEIARAHDEGAARPAASLAGKHGER